MNWLEFSNTLNQHFMFGIFVPLGAAPGVCWGSLRAVNGLKLRANVRKYSIHNSISATNMFVKSSTDGGGDLLPE